MRRACVLAVLATLAPPAARAADITDVASAFDEDNPFDFRFRARYDHLEKRGQIKRELEGLSPSQAQIAIDRDLLYTQSQDALTLRAEFGLFQDLMIHVELPVILQMSQSYSFDQSLGSACTFPPSPMPGCVNTLNSSTIADGIVPIGGFDAQHNGVAVGPGPLLFRGAQRGAVGGSGLDAFDTFNFGLTWAPVNQKRDDTKPTWIIAFAPEISIGNVMQFDRNRPQANHAVSEGVHRLFARTAISHRWRFVDPYIEFWYFYPIARSDSLFKDYGPSQRLKNPQQQGGTEFGAELIAFENVNQGHKVYFDLRGRISGHFSGKGYSEAWELLAGSPALDCNAATNPACSVSGNPYSGPFTGVTTIENYASLGADIGVGAQVGQHFRLKAMFDYAHDQSHFITGEDIGVPQTTSGRVMSPSEYNPAYRQTIDLIGRRYRVDNVDWYNFQIWAQLQF
jgi:hypothetical protein